ncbi:protein [Lentinula edodes]|uniref:Protein YAE1 n=1 Tax=Lentinula edodes TaxID=5353 RepID=A0A1Q3EA73_LENED|nr:protein [Lentinula edodes]
MSSEFTTTGYREGITAGKESALQEGFDTGFATIGTPIGREVGMLRGMVSALLASINGSEKLPRAPRDLEAEAHAREHFEMNEEDAGMEESKELAEKRQMEGLEDMLKRLNSGGVDTDPADQYKKSTLEDVQALRQRIISLWILYKQTLYTNSKCSMDEHKGDRCSVEMVEMRATYLCLICLS